MDYKDDGIGKVKNCWRIQTVILETRIEELQKMALEHKKQINLGEI